MVAQPCRCSSLNWRKSSVSGGTGECVEVASLGSLVLTRDSRNRDGIVLEFTSDQWLCFMGRVKDAEVRSS
jgi:hypothetical protein